MMSTRADEILIACIVRVGGSQAARGTIDGDLHLSASAANARNWLGRSLAPKRSTSNGVVDRTCCQVVAEAWSTRHRIRRYAGMAITRSCSPSNDGRPHQSP